MSNKYFQTFCIFSKCFYSKSLYLYLYCLQQQNILSISWLFYVLDLLLCSGDPYCGQCHCCPPHTRFAVQIFKGTGIEIINKQSKPSNIKSYCSHPPWKLMLFFFLRLSNWIILWIFTK